MAAVAENLWYVVKMLGLVQHQSAIRNSLHGTWILLSDVGLPRLVTLCNPVQSKALLRRVRPNFLCPYPPTASYCVTVSLLQPDY